MRVGVVGAGMIAGCHVRAYASRPDVEVVGVADPRQDKAEQLAATVGATACSSLEDLLDAGVDAVSVCTPSRTHADLVVRAVEAGRHVLCEKPVTATMAEGRRVLRAAQDSRCVVMVGHVSRFEPEHRTAHDLVAHGQIGRVAMMLHSVTASMPGWSEGGWLADPHQSGGPLLDLSVHSFDYLAWVCGSPAVRVQAVAADSPAGPATYTVATVRYANGAMAQAEASWAHPAERGFQAVVELTGTQGRIGWDYRGIVGGAIYAAGEPPTWFDPVGERGFPAEVGAFVSAVRDGGPSPVPVEVGLEALRTALAAHESLRTGQPVDLTTWERA